MEKKVKSKVVDPMAITGIPRHGIHRRRLQTQKLDFRMKLLNQSLYEDVAGQIEEGGTGKSSNCVHIIQEQSATKTT